MRTFHTNACETLPDGARRQFTDKNNNFANAVKKKRRIPDEWILISDEDDFISRLATFEASILIQESQVMQKTLSYHMDFS